MSRRAAVGSIRQSVAAASGRAQPAVDTPAVRTEKGLCCSSAGWSSVAAVAIIVMRPDRSPAAAPTSNRAVADSSAQTAPPDIRTEDTTGPQRRSDDRWRLAAHDATATGRRIAPATASPPALTGRRRWPGVAGGRIDHGRTSPRHWIFRPSRSGAHQRPRRRRTDIGETAGR